MADDDYAFNEHSNALREQKALKVAKWLFRNGVVVDQAIDFTRAEQLLVEKSASVRPTKHPDLLWSRVWELLEWADSDESPLVRPTLVERHSCGCPVKGLGHKITNPERHEAYHRLVEEQEGPYGEVSAATLRELRPHGAPYGNNRVSPLADVPEGLEEFVA